MPFERIAGLNPVVRTTVSLLVLVLVTILDLNISHEINTNALYFIAIVIFSYNNQIPFKFLVIFCGLASIAWGIVDHKTNIYEEGNYIGLNMLLRFVAFSILAYVLNRFYLEKTLRRTIAEQKLAQEESNRQLKAANDDLNRFVGMAAHDIRNPVGAIQMTSEMLMEDDSLQGETRAFVGMIHTAAANSLQILNDTLQISKIQSGTITLHMAKTDYIAFVKEDLRMNEYLAQRKKQKLRFEAMMEKAEAVFDKTRLLQVINNLLTNAIKYSEPGKSILVRIGWDNEANTELRTEVIDEGLGIDEKYHAALFDPFTTTSNQTTGNESKTGLGLSIAKKIVEMHHGQIGFTSEKGKGSTFFFTFPVEQPLS